MAALGVVVVFLLTAVVGSIWRGYVLSVLWKWFVVAHFGLPLITIPVAIGISLLASMLTHQHTNTGKDNKEPLEQLLYIFVMTFLLPLISLGIGAIVAFYV